MTEKIEKQEDELNNLKLKLSEVEKALSEVKIAREDNLRSYQRMVGGFLKAFKSKAKRIMQIQKFDLNFSELEKVIPSDLAKVASEEEAAKKSASK